MINYTSWPIILQNMKAIVPTTLRCIHKVKRDRRTDKVKYYITLILPHAGHKNNLTIYILIGKNPAKNSFYTIFTYKN